MQTSRGGDTPRSLLVAFRLRLRAALCLRAEPLGTATTYAPRQEQEAQGGATPRWNSPSWGGCCSWSPVVYFVVTVGQIQADRLLWWVLLTRQLKSS